MKKIILTVSVVGLIIISSIVVAAATGFGKLQLDENGKVDASKLDPIIYDSVTHAYWQSRCS